MKSITKKFFGYLVTSLLMLSMFNIILTAGADPDMPTLSVEPSLVVLTMGTETFDVNITIRDLSIDYRAVGLEFRLGFDIDLINVTTVVEGPFLQNPEWNHYGTLFFDLVEDSIILPNGTEIETHALVGNILLPNATGDYTDFAYGDGVLATITFTAISPDVIGICDLDLWGVAITNPEKERLPAHTEDGIAKIHVATISASPSLIMLPTGTDEFTVDIDISDLSLDHRCVGLEFRVEYDDTKLEVVDVVEGPFLDDPTWAPFGTIFFYIIEPPQEPPDPPNPAHILVGMLIVPNATGDWEFFPYGAGTLATITFRWIQFRDSYIIPYATALSNPESVRMPTHTEDAYVKMPRPTLSVDPSMFVGPIDTDEFEINITISDLYIEHDVVGIEFRLAYADMYLEVVDITEGPFMQAFGTTYFIPSVVSQTEGFPPHVHVGIVLLPPWTTIPEGEGTLATITFRWKQYGASELELMGDDWTPLQVRLVDTNSDTLPSPNLEHGYVEVPLATLCIEPPLTQAFFVGDTFDVNVTISDLSVAYHFVGIEFRVAFNDTLLEVVDVTAGPFLDSPLTFYNVDPEAWFPNGTYVPSSVVIGQLLLPPWTDFPYGDGVLVTITFEVIYQETMVDIAPPPLTGEFSIFAGAISDPAQNRQPVDYCDPAAAYEIYPRHLCDLNLDGYVGIDDLIICGEAFGSSPGHIRWNPEADVNGDNYVGIDDIVICAQNFGWPT
ncbi:MAG: hypothetical protein JSV05_09500 [Candidatus Bathyarchaeota archaeon]|nr:MAG: hypothetical protein JSV05_09500 [Candidatus Bathyarchaeota archaeon]